MIHYCFQPFTILLFLIGIVVDRDVPLWVGGLRDVGGGKRVAHQVAGVGVLARLAGGLVLDKGDQLNPDLERIFLVNLF